MVKITVEMVRNKAEHHDRLLAPLEEIALHQENIEKIEFLQDWCPKLKILLMQSNLIAKIENLNKLKYLTYLNLALNNIEVIENLERCESLQKLDLTLNFIGEIVSVESLIDNYNLTSLYLTGNPCTDYDNYRDFIIGTLPQLSSLDGKDIERSERIKALQNLYIIRSDILFEQENYKCQRKLQKSRLEREIRDKWENEYSNMDYEERNKKFWSEKTEHAPEVRYEIERMRQMKLKSCESSDKKEEKREIRLFTLDGRPLNVNQPKIDFKFMDTVPNFVLDLAIYKHLDTSLLDIDIQSNYVRVIIKSKIFQMHLPEEVDITNSSAQRSQITGHLVVTMPKANFILKQPSVVETENIREPFSTEAQLTECHSEITSSKREFLEIGPSHNVLDLTKMTETKQKASYIDPRLKLTEKKPSLEFVDNPDVPDLI